MAAPAEEPPSTLPGSVTVSRVISTLECPTASSSERRFLAEGGRTQSIKRRRASAIRRFCARTLPRNEPLQRHEAEQCERAAQCEVRTASGHIDDACANGRAYRDRHLNHADEERRASLRRIGDTSLDPDTAAQGQRAERSTPDEHRKDLADARMVEQQH